jgi:hypothetical protein
MTRQADTIGLGPTFRPVKARAAWRDYQALTCWFQSPPHQSSKILKCGAAAAAPFRRGRRCDHGRDDRAPAGDLDGFPTHCWKKPREIAEDFLNSNSGSSAKIHRMTAAESA